jgi:hypothetical protein
MAIYETKPEPGPLETAFQRAIEAECKARDVWHDSEDALEEQSPSYLAWEAASDATRAAQLAFLASDEPRSYTYREEGYEITFWANSDSEAIEHAEEMLRNGDYNEVTETFWPSASVEGEDGDRHSVSIAVDPDEPSCEEGSDHDWKSPYRLVGGIKENPGVWGNGGGVITNEVCMHCGCGKTTNTWATDRSNGTQGHTSVSYEPGRYQIEQA